MDIEKLTVRVQKSLNEAYNEAVKQLNSAINWFNSEGKVDPSHIEKLNANILKALEAHPEVFCRKC
mgnify:CR=1 FL=1